MALRAKKVLRERIAIIWRVHNDGQIAIKLTSCHKDKVAIVRSYELLVKLFAGNRWFMGKGKCHVLRIYLFLPVAKYCLLFLFQPDTTKVGNGV